MAPKPKVTVSVLGEQAVESKASGNRHTYSPILASRQRFLFPVYARHRGEELPAQEKRQVLDGNSEEREGDS